MDALVVDNLCLNYKCIRKYSIRKSLFQRKDRDDNVFHALKHVSFAVKKGCILGIVGKNGSGKSTLLRAVAGVFTPDSGRIDVKGHSVSLLSLGVGFHKEVSGRENILLSGLLLGFSKQIVLEKMREIIDFSELGALIDAPVRTYSSGMHSKLAFSITAILETDIMLVDEVLSVGDTAFKEKSYRKMKSLISDEKRTVLLVSHSIKRLEELCDEILWLHEGEVKKHGKTDETLKAYLNFIE